VRGVVVVEKECGGGGGTNMNNATDKITVAASAGAGNRPSLDKPRE